MSYNRRHHLFKVHISCKKANYMSGQIEIISKFHKTEYCKQNSDYSTVKFELKN